MASEPGIKVRAELSVSITRGDSIANYNVTIADVPSASRAIEEVVATMRDLLPTPTEQADNDREGQDDD